MYFSPSSPTKRLCLGPREENKQNKQGSRGRGRGTTPPQAPLGGGQPPPQSPSQRGGTHPQAPLGHRGQSPGHNMERNSTKDQKATLVRCVPAPLCVGAAAGKRKVRKLGQKRSKRVRLDREETTTTDARTHAWHTNAGRHGPMHHPDPENHTKTTSAANAKKQGRGAGQPATPSLELMYTWVAPTTDTCNPMRVGTAIPRAHPPVQNHVNLPRRAVWGLAKHGWTAYVSVCQLMPAHVSLCQLMSAG